MSDIDHDSLDAHAFADACRAAPEVHPDRARLIVDAYTAALHIRVVQHHEDRPLTAEEALEAFRPRDDVEF